MPLPAAAEVRPEREEGEKSTREKISPACFAASSPSLPPKPEQRTRERALLNRAGRGRRGRKRAWASSLGATEPWGVLVALARDAK